MKNRIVFYVWWCTADENQDGIHHKSVALPNVDVAQLEANSKWKHNDFVSIDKVVEVYADNAWRQQDGTETEVIEVL